MYAGIKFGSSSGYVPALVIAVGVAILIAIGLLAAWMFWRMKPPRFQFGTSTLLLATTFAAICVGGTLPFWRALTPNDWRNVVPFFGTLLPLLIPCLFVGIAIGRRALTPRMVLSFAISEAVSSGIFLWLVPM